MKTWIRVCPDKVYWPINGRCWPSGARGPCDLGRVIVLDKEAVEAKCVPESEVSKYPFQNVITPWAEKIGGAESRKWKWISGIPIAELCSDLSIEFSACTLQQSFKIYLLLWYIYESIYYLIFRLHFITFINFSSLKNW